MRSLVDVVNKILVIIGNQKQSDNLITLQAELRIISNRALYFPPEGTANIWTDLGTALYRYLPHPTDATWAWDIGKIIRG